METAGDCYIAAGGLTITDEDGFISIDPEPKPDQSAQRVLAFAKVRTPATLLPLRVVYRCMSVAVRAPYCTTTVSMPMHTHTHTLKHTRTHKHMHSHAGHPAVREDGAHAAQW